MKDSGRLGYIKTNGIRCHGSSVKSKLNAESDLFDLAARALRNGNLVVFPTETVYGLGADALNESAINRIYEVKGRPKNHPLIIHFAECELINEWAVDIPDYALKLAETFWPGPVTLILKKSNLAKDYVTGSQNTVGLRVPNHPMALKLLNKFHMLGGAGVAAPSANKFGGVSATTKKVVEEQLKKSLTINDFILDGGKSRIGIESTIIDCTENSPSILRPGWVTVEMIEECLNVNVITRNFSKSVRHSGSFESHYKPKAKIFLELSPGKGDGMYAFECFKTPPGVIRLGSPRNTQEFARDLYSALSSADRKKIKSVYILPPQGIGLAEAVLDRLRKASSPNLQNKLVGKDTLKYNLSYENVIGRNANLLDDEILRSQKLSGERILITGAGGTIGSRIALELSKYGNCSLLLTDRDENRLHSLSLEMTGTALFTTSQFKVLDIKDLCGTEICFTDFQPTIVIHAAALKHLSILENQPREAFLTNVIGTSNLLQTSIRFSGIKFLNISTDKAVNPTSILGKTKWISELLTSYYRKNYSSNYTSVRFGNVFNSRGSVIETFVNQLSNVQPITLTNENVSRYFMKIEEAANLSIASVLMNYDEIHLLDMGEPIKLVTVIERLKEILASKSRIEIVGLRPGEKLNEELIASYEVVSENPLSQIRSIHSKIYFKSLPELNKQVKNDHEARNEISNLIKNACDK